MFENHESHPSLPFSDSIHQPGNTHGERICPYAPSSILSLASRYDNHLSTLLGPLCQTKTLRKCSLWDSSKCTSDHSTPFPQVVCVGFLALSPFRICTFCLHSLHSWPEAKPSCFPRIFFFFFSPYGSKGGALLTCSMSGLPIVHYGSCQIPVYKEFRSIFFFLLWYQGINNKKTGKELQSASCNQYDLMQSRCENFPAPSCAHHSIGVWTW